jgi:hypothetical protein
MGLADDDPRDKAEILEAQGGRIAGACSKGVAGPDPETRGRDAHPSLHPALVRLSGVLGRDAAEFARRHRYAGLGRLQLICNRLFGPGNE